MFYRQELQFLRDVFKKVHVGAMLVAQDTLRKKRQTSTPTELHDRQAPAALLSEELLDTLTEGTRYHLTDSFGFCYIYLLLPHTDPRLLLFIGPYLPVAFSAERILEIGESNGISPDQQKHWMEYYSGIPVISEGSHLHVMLNTFCERIWKSPSFAIVNVNQKSAPPASPINQVMREDEFNDLLLNMKTMEQRYAIENELMRAVSLGQLHIETQLTSMFSENAFEKRIADPIRNAKNYCIIMNTLLRKAAENGGVHPVYLDNVSSAFAKKIELISSLEENAKLMLEMFRTYCRLVRKHTLKQFSPPVQKTILLIDSDISADLSLKALANAQSISAGYLSTIFKKETGKTVSEYIRERRIAHAAHLLESTNLQIQTVALHCGIIDVQYFSKLFKRQMGKTPSEYRLAFERVNS